MMVLVGWFIDRKMEWMMNSDSSWSWIWGVVVVGSMIGGSMVILKWVMKRVNWWLYERKLGEKQYSLPPGDMGWPFIGNMWSFLRAFKTTHPDSFVDSFVSRYPSLCLFSFSFEFFYYIFVSYYLTKFVALVCLRS